MDLETKKLLPDEGVKWLFIRAQATRIANGRMDVTFWIMDAGLEVVAISHHICFVVDIVAGMKQSKKKYEKGQSKI